MKPVPHNDLCIIGAGAGGLSVAACAAQMGATVVLIEDEKMGGDSLNYGCIPSKSLLASAQITRDIRRSNLYGINTSAPEINYSKVHANIRDVIAQIAPQDSINRFTQLGVTVISGKAQFIDTETVKVNDIEIKARRFIIATGSSPAIPSIPGLSTIPFFTNETIFDLAEKPNHLIIIGGGSFGCELAHAYLLLGTHVTLLEAVKILPKDDADIVDLLRKQLINDGLDLHEHVKVTKAEKSTSGVTVTYESNGTPRTIDGSHLLIAAGRHPKITDLNLEAAGVIYSSHGITVNQRLQTSNKKIYAIGDVAGGFQFTHLANYQAGIVVKNTLFRCPIKAKYNALPWVTFTVPELAHVGMTEADAIQMGKKVRVLEMDFNDIDRAQAEHETVGKIKVITTSCGRILGATILGAHAGELILPWVLAIHESLPIRAMANIIAPYPTMSEISKRVASSFYKPKLMSKFTRFVVRMLAKFA